MQMPATPDQHRFYTALLFELKAPHPPRTSLSVLESLTRGLLATSARARSSSTKCTICWAASTASNAPR
jgi:hypothetical protein